MGHQRWIQWLCFFHAAGSQYALHNGLYPQAGTSTHELAYVKMLEFGGFFLFFVLCYFSWHQVI